MEHAVNYKSRMAARVTEDVPVSQDEEVVEHGRDTSSPLTSLATESTLRCLPGLSLELGYYHSKSRHHFLGVLGILREQLLLN